jgi:hypothetical protein
MFPGHSSSLHENIEPELKVAVERQVFTALILTRKGRFWIKEILVFELLLCRSGNITKWRADDWSPKGRSPEASRILHTMGHPTQLDRWMSGPHSGL